MTTLDTPGGELRPATGAPPAGHVASGRTGGAGAAARPVWGTGGRLLSHRGERPTSRPDAPVTTAMTQAVARALVPVCVMVAMATLIKGYTDTGDGFSAGVILALAAVTQMACFGPAVVERSWPLRNAPRVAFGGLALSLAVTLVPTLFGHPVLTHWPPPDASVLHVGSLEVITAVAFDVGVCGLVFGFVVGTMTLLARVAAVAAISQAQSPAVSRRRAPIPSAQAHAARDHRPAHLEPTEREREVVRRPDDPVERGEVTSR
jgi:multicomponent Na+:H+ antiporter subunit B